jgi:NhaP-type Na+/H+ or K+/H+ antiporter
MEMIAFLAVGVVLYFVADWLLRRIEAFAKRRFEYRTLIFFGILLGLALIVFPLLRN